MVKVLTDVLYTDFCQILQINIFGFNKKKKNIWFF